MREWNPCGLRSSAPARPEDAQPEAEPLIVPLAIPALATVMLLVSQQPGQRWEWVAALSISMLARALVLPIAERLQRLVGQRVLEAVEHLMGLILVAVVVEMILRAITALV